MNSSARVNWQRVALLDPCRAEMGNAAIAQKFRQLHAANCTPGMPTHCIAQHAWHAWAWLHSQLHQGSIPITPDVANNIPAELSPNAILYPTSTRSDRVLDLLQCVSQGPLPCDTSPRYTTPLRKRQYA